MTTTIQPGTGTPDPTVTRSRNEATWRRAALALYARDIEEFVRHWTTDGRYEVAYPVDGLPPLVEGHDAFRAMFGGLTSATEQITVHDVRFHQTDDPDVAFVEERMVADLVGGGRYENTLVLRVRFRGELIQEIFEYYGQVAHQELVNSLGGAR